MDKIKHCAGEEACESREVALWQDFLRRYAQQDAGAPDIFVVNAGEKEFIMDTLNVHSTRSDVSVMPLSGVAGRGRGPSLTNELLAGVSLKGRNLANARLAGLELSGVDLSGTDLRFAFLTNANLEGAKLTGADLTGANLVGANLTGADLGGVKLFDDDEMTALPVAFIVEWDRVIFDTSSLSTGMYIKQVNLDKVSHKTYVTFLLLNGNGANISGANFEGSSNLSAENRQYICRWGGRVAWKVLGEACNGVETSTYNPFAATLEPYPGRWLTKKNDQARSGDRPKLPAP
jgi:uncharacterized protein YjbI with pentapeptide repeats